MKFVVRISLSDIPLSSTKLLTTIERSVSASVRTTLSFLFLGVWGAA